MHDKNKRRKIWQYCQEPYLEPNQKSGGAFSKKS